MAVCVHACECSEYVWHSWPTLIRLSLQRMMCVRIYARYTYTCLSVFVSCKWLLSTLTHSLSVGVCMCLFVCLLCEHIMAVCVDIKVQLCVLCMHGWRFILDTQTHALEDGTRAGERVMEIGRDTMAMYRWQETSNAKKTMNKTTTWYTHTQYALCPCCNLCCYALSQIHHAKMERNRHTHSSSLPALQKMPPKANKLLNSWCKCSKINSNYFQKLYIFTQFPIA